MTTTRTRSTRTDRRDRAPGSLAIRLSLLFGLVLAGASDVAKATGSYAYGHPDQYYRGKGLHRYESGEYAGALGSLRIAARYADKTAQLALALMYRDGRGVAADPALAYAWADLAAERGYPDFVAVREKLWSALDDAGRARAIAAGAMLYAELGDAVAKPRLERRLATVKRKMLGSRAGFRGHVGVADFSGRDAMGTPDHFRRPSQRPVGNNVATLLARVAESGDRNFWSDESWSPAAYWRHQDAIWLRPTVEVGAPVLDETR